MGYSRAQECPGSSVCRTAGGRGVSAVARDLRQSESELLLVDQATGKTFAGTEKGLTTLAPADVTVASGAITRAKGYEVLKGDTRGTIECIYDIERVPTLREVIDEAADWFYLHADEILRLPGAPGR